MKYTEIENRLSEITTPEVQMKKLKEVTQNQVIHTGLQNSAYIGVLFILGFVFTSYNVNYFLDIPSLIVVLGIPLSLILVTYGINGIKALFKAPFIKTIPEGEERNFYCHIYRDCKTYLIVAGWVGTISGFVTMGHLVKDAQGVLDVINGGSVAFLTVLYGYIFAYFLCHPILKRFDSTL